MMVELEVAQVVVDPFLSAPVLVLQDPVTGRRFVCRVGQGEAVSLLSVIEKIPLDCPTTHDLLLALLDALGARVVRAELDGRDERGSCATVVVAAPGRPDLRLGARVVDAVAIALRAGAPIHADDSLLDVAVEVGLDGCAGCPEWGVMGDGLETLPDEDFPKYRM